MLRPRSMPKDVLPQVQVSQLVLLKNSAGKVNALFAQLIWCNALCSGPFSYCHDFLGIFLFKHHWIKFINSFGSRNWNPVFCPLSQWLQTWASSYCFTLWMCLCGCCTSVFSVAKYWSAVLSLQISNRRLGCSLKPSKRGSNHFQLRHARDLAVCFYTKHTPLPPSLLVLLPGGRIQQSLVDDCAGCK